MKRRTKEKIIPRSLLSRLVGDIKHMMESNEGRLFALEMLEEIPASFRSMVIDSLAGFHERELAVFFHLLREEYGSELEAAISKALSKLAMAGVPVTRPEFSRGRFFAAYATRTRHLGQITVDVAWEKPSGGLDVECFCLTFGPEGVHSTFALSDVAVRDFEADRRKLSMVEDISLKEAAFLIRESYQFNLIHMTKPGPGRFLFRKYLDMPFALSEAQRRELFERLSEPLSPKQLVNSVFLALRRRDHSYIVALVDEEKLCQKDFVQYLQSVLGTGHALMEGYAVGVKTGGRYAVVKAQCVTLADEEVEYRELSFYLKKRRGNWYIYDVYSQLFESASTSSEEVSPFFKVFCYVYEVLDIDELLGTLELLNHVEDAGEIPGGIHLRIGQHDDDFVGGGFFLPGMWADIVLKGDEMVMMGKDLKALETLHELVTKEQQTVLIMRREMSVLAAYKYLSGQYLSLHDVVAGGQEDSIFEDGMKFVSARYFMRDRDRVLTKLQGVAGQRYDLPGGLQVHYEYRVTAESSAEIFVAEYIVGDNWVTVSAYGDGEISAVRKQFEQGIEDCLHFEGLEIKEAGIFEILTREIKAQYPNLEARLKKAYLDKWYFSKSNDLGGISPAQARQSEEGQRRLWALFKEMSRKRKTGWRGDSIRRPGLREYLERVYLPGK